MLRALIVLIFLNPIYAFAIEDIQLDYRAVAIQKAGIVRDGTIIAYGKVVYYGMHSGFRLWIAPASSNEINGLYVIRGRNSAKSDNLRVRIDSEFSVKDDATGGLKIYSEEYSVPFKIVTVGDQDIKPGLWDVTINASAITQ